MKHAIKKWMPLIAVVALVAVPLVMFGLKWHWVPLLFGYPLPVPVLG